jgi:hypothetical protein
VHHPLSLYLARPRGDAPEELRHRPQLDRPDAARSRSGLRARLAERRRRARSAAVRPTPVTLRIAHPADSGALAELALLDERRPPTGTVLLAEVDHRLVAAIPLDDGPALRHPLAPSADALELLELRRLQLRASRVAA